MDSYCKDILKIFKNAENIEKAIISMDKMIYSSLTKILMENNTQHKKNLKTDGEETAKKILAKTLIIFRRQIKHRKITILVSKNDLTISKPGAEKKNGLQGFLLNLFILINYIYPGRQGYENAQILQKKMTAGIALHKVNEFRDLVYSTIHQLGCTNNDDKQEIFNDSLVVLWQKLSEAEIGLYFKDGQTDRMRDCFVYNCRFYQNSKLSTFLAGVAKNLFLNRLRMKNFIKGDFTEIIEPSFSELAFDSIENPIAFLFSYYRSFIEPRILRSVVSILQYDCGLEDNGVKNVLGINNARIHSSRLRSHFHNWYKDNLNNIPQLIDKANDYVREINEKSELLNRKINEIHIFQQTPEIEIDLSIFSEEFRSEQELNEYAIIFSHIFYFASTGKLSKLSGLPDEEVLKKIMIAYKKHLFQLPEYQILLWLLFYGSDEPVSIIERHLIALEKELSEQSESSESINRLQQQIKSLLKSGNLQLKNEIYKANNILFKGLSCDNNFLKPL